jgi:hypothetical protein
LRAHLLIAAVGCLFLLPTGCGSSENAVPGKGNASTTSTPVNTTTASNDVSEPVIDGRFPVGADGHKLAMLCLGEGSPTIILESGVEMPSHSSPASWIRWRS